MIRVRGGGTGRVSVAGLACYRPGDRSRLIYRLHCYRGRKGETKAFTLTEYRDLLIAAHAVHEKATLVTRNQSEFRRVSGLRVESWI